MKEADWWGKLNERLIQALDCAVEVLARAGAFLDIDDELIERDGNAAAVVAAYLVLEEGRDEREPPSPEQAAALFIIYLWYFTERGIAFVANLKKERLNLEDVGELVWIGADLGAVSEWFLSEFYGWFDDPGETPDWVLTGARNGGKKAAEKADRWRIPALEKASRLRAKNPKIGQGALAEKLAEELPDLEGRLPRRDGLIRQIREWERTGHLPVSAVHPSRRGEA